MTEVPACIFMETQHLLSTEANRRALERSMAQHRAGEGIPFNLEEAERMIKQ